MSTPVSNKPTVAVDLDGTLAEYHGWKGIDHIGLPRPGAVEFVKQLRLSYRVVLYTARMRGDRPIMERAQAGLVIEKWLADNGIVVDDVWRQGGKPMAAAYLDDRAVVIQTNPVEEDYSAALADIRHMVEAHKS